jgi:hypothetical protein
MSDSEARDGKLILDSMIDSWNASRMMIHQISRSLYSLVVSTATYTLGTGGDFNATRPARIEQAGLVLAGTSPAKEEKLDIYDHGEWAGVTLKTQEGKPTVLYNDHASPLATLSFWKVPDEAHQVALYTWAPLSTFADLTTTIQLPPGYQDAIRYTLALKLAIEWGLPRKADVAEEARQAMAKVQSQNITQMDMDLDLDPALRPMWHGQGGIYDFDTNGYR